MRATILGSAAGGAFPQWNCGCPGCSNVRAGAPGWTARTQDSLALAEDGERFVLVNASPDILVQIARTSWLHPRSPRHSPIAAIVLTNGDLDHVLGLFSLRESWPLAIYATASVWRGLEESLFLRTLRRFPEQLAARHLVLDEEVELADAKGEALGVHARGFALPGKLPVHLVGHGMPSAEDNIGLSLRGATGPRIAYAAACATVDERVRTELAGHDVVLFDGTFYREDELVRLGLSRSVAKDMAHVPIDGEAGSLAALEGLGARRIYTHVNNTNPILGPTEERKRVEAAGWEVASDGMAVDA